MAQKLDADLNIIQRSGIEIEVDPLTKDLNIIQQLDDEPNDVGGLSAQELKAKFDEAGNTIKDYINGSLIPQVLEDGLTEQARQEHEEQRQTNEAQRQENEEARIAAEAAREEAAADLNQSLSESVGQLEAGIEAAEAARNVWEDYDGAKAYVPGNKVYYLGSSYVNTAACQNVLPTVTEYWQIIAKKGADSDEGMSQEEGDLRYLQLTGGIMTGPLSVLPPTEPNHPATKEYADEIKTRAEDTYPKAQSLSANTAAMLGLPTEATPDEALAQLAAGIGNHAFLVHLRTTDGRPVSGATIQGLTSVTGGSVVTDANGDVFGISSTATVSVTIPTQWLDVANRTESLTSTGVLTEVTITPPSKKAGSVLQITSSGTVQFLYDHDATVCCAGGGTGGGFGGSTTSKGKGGVGGKIKNEDVLLSAGAYPVQIGAGGAAGTSSSTNGKAGGATTFAGVSSYDGSTINYALDDSSRLIGGNGGDGGRAKAADGTSGTRAGGGGGGAAGGGKGGGSPGGTAGANGSSAATVNANSYGGKGGDGGGGGGGGGGGLGYVGDGIDNSKSGGNGGTGIVLVKLLS